MRQRQMILMKPESLIPITGICTSFYQFAKDMQFIPKLCQPYRPQTKGKVERMVRYVRDNFYRPFVTKDNGLHAVCDVATLNATAGHWLDNVANQRIHDTVKEKPAECIFWLIGITISGRSGSLILVLSGSPFPV
jgi:hypothetical protein